MKLPKTKTEILKTMIVTIDGPAGSGKTTTAHKVAERLGLWHLDTGAMYRATTLKAMELRVDTNDKWKMRDIANRAAITFEKNKAGHLRVFLDGHDVSEAIRSQTVTNEVSLVSSQPMVRQAMVRLQRSLCEKGGVVLEGRDIGSVVLPSADVKIYLNASVDMRALRRMNELHAQGVDKTLESVRQDIVRRDHLDSTREASPLKIPIGAAIIDTSEKTIEEQVEAVVSVVDAQVDHLLSLAPQKNRKSRLTRPTLLWTTAKLLILTLLQLIWGARIEKKTKYFRDESYIFAANHLSNADPPLVAATLDREVHFAAKASLFKPPWFARLITHVNAVPIRRGRFDRQAMDLFVDILNSGRSMLMFPEGRRMDGEELGEGKGGIGYLALRSGATVVPIYVRGSNRLRSAIFRRPRLTVLQGKPIRLTDKSTEKYQSPEDFREFGRMVMAAISALQQEVDADRADRMPQRRRSGTTPPISGSG